MFLNKYYLDIKKEIYIEVNFEYFALDKYFIDDVFNK